MRRAKVSVVSQHGRRKHHRDREVFINMNFESSHICSSLFLASILVWLQWSCAARPAVLPKEKQQIVFPAGARARVCGDDIGIGAQTQLYVDKCVGTELHHQMQTNVSRLYFSNFCKKNYVFSWVPSMLYVEIYELLLADIHRAALVVGQFHIFNPPVLLPPIFTESVTPAAL